MRDGLVSQAELEGILDEQRDSQNRRMSGNRLGEILIERGLVPADQIARLVAEQYELPFIDLKLEEIDLRVAQRLHVEQARRFAAVPISAAADGSVLLAIADPSTVLFSDELRRHLNTATRFAVTGPGAIADAIAFVYSGDAGAGAAPAPVHEARSDLADIVVGLPDETGETSLGTVWDRAQRTASHLWPPLGALLVRDDLVGEDELERALAQQRLSTSWRLGDILVNRGLVTKATIARLVAEQYELPFVELRDVDFDRDVARRLAQDIAREYPAVPIAANEDGSLEVAIADPTNAFYSDELRRALDAPLTFVVAAPDAILAVIDLVHAEGDSDVSADEAGIQDVVVELPLHDTCTDIEPHGDDAVEPAHQEVIADAEPSWTDSLALSEEEIGDDEPHDSEPFVPRAEWMVPALVVEPEVAGGFIDDVDGLGNLDVPDDADDEPRATDDTVEPDEPSTEIHGALERLLALGATSVHFSPGPESYAVRARVDGVVGDVGVVAADGLAELLSSLEAGHPLRRQIAATAHGDKVTLFAIEHPMTPTSLSELGLDEALADGLEDLLRTRSGVFLVTGPIDSGIATTLRAALATIGTDEKTAAAVVARADAHLERVDLIEVNDGTEVTAPDALRALLDSDTDVILVDEIRDPETAAVVFQAGLSGHPMLAGLRAPTTMAAIRRLSDLGVQPGLLSDALTCVVAQRLVRRVCNSCRETYYASESELVELGLPPEKTSTRLLARGRGCEACAATGYRGRIGVFEMLPMTAEIRSLVLDGASPKRVQRAVAEAGVTTLHEDAVRLCLEGVTTSAEVRRLLGKHQ